MVMPAIYHDNKADRVFTPVGSYLERSILYFNPRPFERLHCAKTDTYRIAFDKRIGKLYLAKELTALVLMSDKQLIYRLLTHIQLAPLPAECWFAGVLAVPRRHPWDEQELSFPTKAWIIVPAESCEQAQRVARQLFDCGIQKSPVHTNSSFGRFVFAYALNTVFLN
jgi:hypothetical protein